MWVYVDKSTRQYKFKCFSTGNYGSQIDIVKELFNIDYSQAVTRILMTTIYMQNQKSITMLNLILDIRLIMCNERAME